MSDYNYTIEQVVSAAFDQNAYVLWRPAREDALVVDPGFDWPGILDLLERIGRRPAVILNTHGHADHIAGNAPLKQRFPEAPIVIGAAEAYLLAEPDANLSGLFGIPLTSPLADKLLREGDRFEAAGFAFDVREISGHSPGALVLIAEKMDPPFVIVGDVLFAGSVGRTDFPGGDSRSLLDGIRAKLYTLPDDVRVYSGHGPPTTIGEQKRSNPYVRA